jgi:hypothetical protein
MVRHLHEAMGRPEDPGTVESECSEAESGGLRVAAKGVVLAKDRVGTHARCILGSDDLYIRAVKPNVYIDGCLGCTPSVLDKPFSGKRVAVGV